jgi:6-phosphofructokinase 1
MDAAAGKGKQMDPHGRLWQSVLEATGQDAFFTD